MSSCLISFGANLGRPAETLQHAAIQLQERLAGGVRDCRLSRLFRTPAVGGPSGQPPFLNAVA
ncbi:MAG: 2-amino-4-hydroxy-6-hydroxymethyldihydropteridine diphosphokinase, partial [Aureliella sp.]